MADDPGFRVTDRRGRAREPEPPPPAPSERPAPAPPVSPPSGDLRPLIAMLAELALAALGAGEEPASAPDLEQAEGAIESLLVLRDRTDGRRTEEETALLERALYEVQLRYVTLAAPER